MLFCVRFSTFFLALSVFLDRPNFPTDSSSSADGNYKGGSQHFVSEASATGPDLKIVFKIIFHTKI